ncbi:hypothetical protein ABIC83_003062 [Roseateles asaccharophilus]|uniref:hypothetical protein n=1 Tax=Roseateles asaccharophilus TaxID=582607 RepID=UPI003835BB5D
MPERHSSTESALLWSAFEADDQDDLEVGVDIELAAPAPSEVPEVDECNAEPDPVKREALHIARRLIRQRKPAEATLVYRQKTGCSPGEAMVALGLRK